MTLFFLQTNDNWKEKKEFKFLHKIKHKYYLYYSLVINKTKSNEVKNCSLFKFNFKGWVVISIFTL